MEKYRRKQLESTEDLLEQIERVTKTSVSADDISIFEAAAASTRPQNKSGSMYDKSVMTRGMLSDMVDQLNSGEKAVPLHTLHNQGGELPIGRVFHGYVKDEIDGSATLIARFYIGKSNKDLIENINLGVIDEVSVGLLPSSAKCSKCGWDYMGEDAGFEHLFSQTCENGHTIGEDGVHLQLTGVQDWTELSLVSRGAADKPKILSRAKEVMPAEEYDRMAASGKPAEAVMLFATNKMEIPMDDDKPTSGETVEFDFSGAFEGLTATLTSLLENVDKLTASAEGVEGVAIQAAEEEPNTEELETVKAQLADAEARIAEFEEQEQKAAAEAAAEAEGAAEEHEPLTAQANLPAGGLAASAVTDAGKKSTPPVVSAVFKSKHRK